MRIAAILSSYNQCAGEGASEDSRCAARCVRYTSLEILGKSLKDRILSKLNEAGVEACTLIASDNASPLLPSRTDPGDIFGEAWENAISNYVRQGIESLLLVRLSAYCDLNYESMVRFHAESGSPVTQAYAPDGALDIAIIDATLLRGVESYRNALSAAIPKQRPYLYPGYVNRLLQPADFYQLIDDGLRGRCNLRPIGRETREWVWQGDESEVHDSAIVTGPAFIGKRSRIAACCRIGSGVAIERDCEVDGGTVVEQSWITQNTYLGVALDFRHSIVNGKELFKLDRNIAMNIDDDHLIAPALKTLPFLASLGDRFRRPESAL